ncbi:MAG: DUF1772 domain-containing protein [Aeromicrobium erythreum]
MILLLAVVATGLVAGLFAAFAYAVMPGLRRADDRTVVQAMRGINAAILNPVFGVLFLASVALPVLLGATRHDEPGGPWLVAGAVLSVGTVLVTLTVNVPLNTGLETSDAEPAAARAAFERRWTAANLVRTATSVAAFGCLVVAALRTPVA